MIFGIGVDVVDIDRMKSAVGRLGERFLNRVFHPDEIAYSFRFRDPYARLSVRFACKEAVSKSLGVGIFLLGAKNIQVVNSEDGNPSVTLHGRAKSFGAQNGVGRILVSLSHGDRFAVAQALALTRPFPSGPSDGPDA